MTSTAQARREPRSHSLATTGKAIGAAVVLGAIGCLIVATIARAAGVSDAFQPLNVGSYLPLVILASVIGAFGWNQVLRRSAEPVRVLKVLVPAVVVVSFVPDLAVGIGKSMPHTTWGGVVALMIMHVLVAAAAVGSYRHFLSPTSSDPRS